jgi:hypothetical protein
LMCSAVFMSLSLLSSPSTLLVIVYVIGFVGRLHSDNYYRPL